MKIFNYGDVKLNSGYLLGKQELNRLTSINSVYDRFYDTGRIGAFNFDYKEGDENMPHIFWDSDVAKWMEGAAYIMKHHNTPDLEQKVDELVSKIKEHQGADGYFNIHFTVVKPNERFTNRDWHELYCAGHLMEAAVAYAEVSEKTEFLDCMEKYADYINQVFIVEKSAKFFTPGHEEIELALVRMYRYTGKKKYLDMAAYFINTRGTVDEQCKDEQFQSHLPVREQKDALGHSVRAMYLYTGMAMLAKETNDQSLIDACKTLWEDVTLRKMYVTGGLGSTRIGEAFTVPYDLQNDEAYTETCAGIGLIFFANAMLQLETDAKYADILERVLYNGVLSGISLDGKSFFYENPLEINLSEHFESRYGKRMFPITQRVECFSCSCCPPNLNRLLPSLGNYIYGIEDDTLYVNQYISSTLNKDNISCTIETNYPINGDVKIKATGAKKLALRIPFWCDSYRINKPYTMKNGYAVIELDGSDVEISFDIEPKMIWADSRIMRDAGRVCIMRGPVVYCAEGIDNGSTLHRFAIARNFKYTVSESKEFGLPTIEVSAFEKLPFEGNLYSNKAPQIIETTLKLIPYNSFANRGETDMLVWFVEK